MTGSPTIITKYRHLLGDVFIWRGNEQVYRLKSDKMMVQNILASELTALGFAGSDVLGESPNSSVKSTVIGPIVNAARQRLRFATAIRADARRIADVKAKLAAKEPLIVATSYPNTAMRELWKLGVVPVLCAPYIQSGGIEALPNQYPAVDIIFELVQSGDSLEENELEILEDNILEINLIKLERRNATNLSYNGGQDGTINPTL